MHPGPWLIVFSLITTSGLFLLSKDNLLSQFSTPLLFFSQLTALIGTTLLAWSYFLSARWRTMETLFGGLDKTYKYHHITGGLTFIFLLQHPLLLAINMTPHPSAVSTFFIPGPRLAYNFGIFSLYLLLVLLAVTLYLRLPYHIWKTTHEFMGLVIILGGLHAYLIPSDVSRFLPLRIWMLGLISLSVLAFVYIKFLYHRIGPVYRYLVSAVNYREEIVEITLTPLKHHLKFKPGQFAFVKFPGLDPFDPHLHPYSISSPPQQNTLSFSVKILGDHTLRLRQLRVGQKAIVTGPHGQFLDYFPLTRHAVMVAGGIGITPFLSVLSASVQIPSSTTLIHSVSAPVNSPYHPQLSLLARITGFNYYLHNSLTQGRLTAGKILDIVRTDLAQAHFFLCGPVPMMNSLADQLISSGIRPSRIIFEDFSFV